eukprot:3638916-Ditylum_brightwellii.AAC.1
MSDSDSENQKKEEDSGGDIDDAWTHPKKPTQQATTSPDPSMNETLEENIFDFMENHLLSVNTIPEEEEEGLATISDQAELL